MNSLQQTALILVQGIIEENKEKLELQAELRNDKLSQLREKRDHFEAVYLDKQADIEGLIGESNSLASLYKT